MGNLKRIYVDGYGVFELMDSNAARISDLNSKLDISFGSYSNISSLQAISNLSYTLQFAELSTSQQVTLSSDFVYGKELYVIIVNTSSSNITIDIPASLNTKTVFVNGTKGSASKTIPSNTSEELAIVLNDKYAFVRIG